MRRLIPLFLMGILLAYLERSLLAPLREVSWTGYAALVTGVLICFGAQLWLFFVFFQAKADEPLYAEATLKTLAFHGMGITSLLLTFTAIRDLIRFPVAWAVEGDRLIGWGSSLGVLGVSGICYFLGLWNARFSILTRTIPFSSKVRARLVQLSDMHLGTGPGVEQIRSLVDRVVAIKPDLIVLTGDIIDGDVGTLGEELKELSRLHAPYGTYFAIGNHECYWGHEKSLEAMRKLGIIPLVNEGTEIRIGNETLYLAGAGDPAMQWFGGSAPVVPAPPAHADYKILLAHQPGISARAQELGYDLQLSGHTHGGQFFPWNLMVRWVHRHSSGLSREGTLSVYVNPGTGYWGPPLRLGTTSEVSEILLGEGLAR
jgi:predicted MPP superfamily phosphohydrolase